MTGEFFACPGGDRVVQHNHNLPQDPDVVEALEKLWAAEARFSEEIEPDLVEAAVYEVLACRLRYRVALRRAREKAAAAPAQPPVRSRDRRARVGD